MLVLAFDPGETTGWCRVDTTASSIEGDSFHLWEGVQRQLLVPFALIGGPTGPDAVIVERFLLYPWSAGRLQWNQLLPVEVIGVIKYVAEAYGISPVVMQNASVAKAIHLAEIPDGFDKHAQDAFRHVLAFLRSGGLLTDKLRGYIK